MNGFWERTRAITPLAVLLALMLGSLRELPVAASTADDEAVETTAAGDGGAATTTRDEADASDEVPVSAAAEPSDTASATDATGDVRDTDAPGEPEEDATLPDTFEGGEIVARVGSEVILGSDVLSDANLYVQRVLKKAPREVTAVEIEAARKLYMARFVKDLIKVKLAVADGRRSLPKLHWEAIETQFNFQFAREYAPKLIAAEGCDTLAEVDLKMHAAGTSLEAHRRQLWESNFARYWVEKAAKVDREISEQQVEDYYQAHQDDYETLARARWKHLMVHFDKVEPNQDAARTAAADAYQKLKADTSFDEVAKTDPENLSIDEETPWIDRGSLVSDVLDQALFTLPIDQLSEILEDDRGLHVICVVEREAGATITVADAESAIREKIEDQRKVDARTEYLAKLEKTIPVWNVFKEAGIGVEFNASAKVYLAEVKPGESPVAGNAPANSLQKGPNWWAFPELFRGDKQEPQRSAP